MDGLDRQTGALEVKLVQESEDFVQTMQGRVLTTADQVRQAVEEMKSTGADELCLWPQVNRLDQVDKLADIVFS